ncbi:serine/threonine-protein kinase [Marinimicrobium locisalis]|uniref:serine/threonine-protein kinase n=1 Tax=Marinimicrobium locisalis TaxID=546022 RepID=UPI0032219859
MQIPGYKIIDTLGEGGMARVYLAIQESVEREVALKVLDPHLSKDPTFGERFMSEARIVSRLVHPNIVTVSDMGVHEDYHYLAMEYVSGRDLKHRRFEMSLPESVRAVKEVARALDYAGSNGCVHRDVKPDNIMLHNDDGRAVLMDFGIARVIDQTSSMTQTGTTVGTPHYMSPEHARGAPVDTRSDLYSLGVVLFLLLCGRLPYDSDSAVSIGVKHVSEEIPRVPRHLVAFQPIIDRILAKSPDERYQSGEKFIEALDQLTPEMLVAMEQEGERALYEELGGRPSSRGDSPTLHQPQAVIAQHEGDLREADIRQMEQLSVNGEDRPSRPPPQAASDSSREGRRRAGLWSVILLSTIGLGALYQWQEPLRAAWQSHVMPWVARVAENVPAMVSADDKLPNGQVESGEGGLKVMSNVNPALPFAGSKSDEQNTEKATNERSGLEVATTEVTPRRPVFEPLLAEPIPLTPPPKAEEMSRQPPSESPSAAETAKAKEEADAAKREAEAAKKKAEAEAAKKEAIAGLTRTAEELGAQGDYTGALALLEEGLQTYPDNPSLMARHEKLREQRERRRRKAAADKAKAEEASRLAQEVAAIEEDLAAGRLEEAGERLMQARERNPGSAELLALEVQWRDQQEWEIQPEINRTRISAQPLESLPAEQTSVISSRRVLHVGFTYRNFDTTSAVIQAMLYDGSREVQVAQVPVIVQGSEGEASFRIERPVNGFAEGHYHLDLVADNRTLSSVSFQVSD